jgi:thymidylate synthase (FAD)
MAALSEYSDEWKYMVDNYFMPKCEVSGFCTEKKCCGRKPYKED